MLTCMCPFCNADNTFSVFNGEVVTHKSCPHFVNATTAIGWKVKANFAITQSVYIER